MKIVLCLYCKDRNAFGFINTGHRFSEKIVTAACKMTEAPVTSIPNIHGAPSCGRSIVEKLSCVTECFSAGFVTIDDGLCPESYESFHSLALHL
jgi:hypothetical protein